jgi:hypothetical protein
LYTSVSSEHYPIEGIQLVQLNDVISHWKKKTCDVAMVLMMVQSSIFYMAGCSTTSFVPLITAVSCVDHITRHYASRSYTVYTIDSTRCKQLYQHNIYIMCIYQDVVYILDTLQGVVLLFEFLNLIYSWKKACQQRTKSEFDKNMYWAI